MLVGIPVAYASPLEVRVEQGALEGQAQGQVVAFLGIPFAAPPIGPLRWKSPQPAPHWSGVRKADRFGANCQQDVVPGDKGFGPWSPEYLIVGPVSEDCLYLNVWKPAQQDGAKRPVLVWIHGGGFNQGSGDVPVYDGAALASQGIVVVNMNYRLGIMGFLGLPQLTAEGGAQGATNFGLSDQIAALRWVRNNIVALGGDPAQVTIAGQSAGAASVHFLIQSPLAKGLFRQAIAESGSGMGIEARTLSDAERTGADVMKASGATTIAALRAMSPADLSAAVKKTTTGTGPFAALRFTPVADGVVLPTDAAAAAASGRFNDTPILTGLNTDEGSGMDPNYRGSDSAAFKAALDKRYGKSAGKFEGLYTADNPKISGPSLSRDRGIASMYFWAEQRSKTSHFPIYAYLFTHVEPGPESARYGVFHSSEIPYVFDTLAKSPGRDFTAEDHAIAATMGKYWLNYVKKGDPNGPGLAPWPKFDAGGSIMELGSKFASRPALGERELTLFRDYVAGGGQLGLF